MKEHSFFLAAAFTPANPNLATRANAFKAQFAELLTEAVSLSNGVVDQSVLASGEVFTPYTLDAEMATQHFTGANLQTGITKAEANLKEGSQAELPASLETRVAQLNNRAIRLVSELIMFKSSVLSDVLSCKIYTFNYPLLIDHILREARQYHDMLQKLQSRQEIESERQAMELEAFWNRIMAEHAKFIRGLLDPSENELIATANNFGNEFDALTAEARAAMDSSMLPAKVTSDSLKATIDIRNFKISGAEGVLSCKIKSIIIPLLSDHVLREANHYLRLLNKFGRFTAFLG
jgi:hypothetical protein